MKQVLWAVDLKLNYSDSLAMSRLMDYVTGGSFNPQLSSYEVPVRKKREQSGRRRRRRTIAKDDEKDIEVTSNINLHLRNKTCSPCLHSLVKTEANV